MGLAWLAAGVGCADSADNNAKPKYTGPMILTEEIDPVENPLSDEPGAIEIPLDQVSATMMRGTLQIGCDKHGILLPNFKQDWLPLLEEIGQALQLSSPRKEDAPHGFAVVGTGLEAFRQIHAVLVKKHSPHQSFQAGSEITLVFFAFESDPYTTLHRVDRVGNRVEIRYRFVWRDGEGIGDRAVSRVALIPLGKLEAGKYHVNYVKSALERKLFGPDFIPENAFQEKMSQELKDRIYKPISREDARKMVCNPFSFTVEEK